LAQARPPRHSTQILKKEETLWHQKGWKRNNSTTVRFSIFCGTRGALIIPPKHENTPPDLRVDLGGSAVKALNCFYFKQGFVYALRTSFELYLLTDCVWHEDNLSQEFRVSESIGP
jgi:hypothetical protein